MSKLMSLVRRILLVCTIAQPITAQSYISEPPDWINGKPLYEIYVRSFTPEGTLNGVQRRLPELKELGISNIWLMPIHPMGELGRKGSAGCPYSVKDYLAIGDEYGTMDDLNNLVEAAHELDMKVMMDMVLNHSANDHIEMENHPDWHMRDSLGNYTREVADWSDITDWNYEIPEVHSYLEDVLVHYVDKIKIDGFRCDVAGMVPHEFWKALFRNSKQSIQRFSCWLRLGSRS